MSEIPPYVFGNRRQKFEGQRVAAHLRACRAARFHQISPNEHSISPFRDSKMSNQAGLPPYVTGTWHHARRSSPDLHVRAHFAACQKARLPFVVVTPKSGGRAHVRLEVETLDFRELSPAQLATIRARVLPVTCRVLSVGPQGVYLSRVALPAAEALARDLFRLAGKERPGNG
jgi:hypothetical protein